MDRAASCWSLNSPTCTNIYFNLKWKQNDFLKHSLHYLWKKTLEVRDVCRASGDGVRDMCAPDGGGVAHLFQRGAYVGLFVCGCMETKIFEKKTSQTTKQRRRHTRKRLKQKESTRRGEYHDIHMLVNWSAARVSLHRQVTTCVLVVCVGLFECQHVCVLGNIQVSPTATTPPSDIMTEYMTGREPEVDRTMLLVLAISFRDNKRQQKGFQRKYSSIALDPLSLGYWFKYETCTPQEK